MSGSEDWSRKRATKQQSHSSLQSITRKPLSPTAMSGPTSHRRTTSDNSSTSSPLQFDGAMGFSRRASPTSTDPQWIPMGPFGPSSPLVDSMDGVDLGTPDLGSSYNNDNNDTRSKTSPQLNQRPPTWHHFPRLTSSGHPKPAPFQFDDNVQYESPLSSSTFSPRGRFQHNRTDSQARLLATPTETRTPYTPPPYTAVLLGPRKKWWHWRPAYVMYVFFILGFLCAVGHHIFYTALDERYADNQLAMLRYGTILAFAAKAGLVAAVVTAFRQRIWATVRNKLLSVAALDSLFAATEDLGALLNLEIYKRAKVATFLAVFVWLTPFCIILTSNTLTVAPVTIVEETKCPGVKTLNFTQESIENWRTATKDPNGFFGLSTSLWNTTWPNTSSSNWYDYWTGPSDNFQQVATLAAFSQQAMPAKNASMDICSGWNCTYTINFTAPGYKCTELASGVGSRLRNLGNNEVPEHFSMDLLLPKGDYSYYAYTSGGEYSPAQMNESEIGGMPKIPPPFPENLGAFRTEPIVWVGYVQRKDPTKTPPNNRSMPGWDDAFIPKVFACENYETAYKVNFTIEGGQQTINILEKDFLFPVIDTTFLQDEDANDGTNDNTTAVPESNYVRPKDDMEHYRRVAAFHSIGYALRQFVNGTVHSASIQNPIQNTRLIQTKLLNPRQEYFPYPNLMEMVQGFYEDIIMSMFSNPQFLVLVWAARPDTKSGTVKGDDSTLYPCTRTRREIRYKYIARDLWIVYSITLIGAIIAIVLGTISVLENEGVLQNTRFSSIVAATRGPALEKVMWRKEDRGDVPPDVKNLKVGYGIVHRAGNALGVATTPVTEQDTRYPERVLWDGGEVRYGFGLEGDVRQMRSEGSIFRHR